MVLKYMVGTDLEKPELKKPETEVEQPRRKAVQPTREVDQLVRPVADKLRSHRCPAIPVKA